MLLAREECSATKHEETHEPRVYDITLRGYSPVQARLSRELELGFVCLQLHCVQRLLPSIPGCMFAGSRLVAQGTKGFGFGVGGAPPVCEPGVASYHGDGMQGDH